ncbi:MAG: hypothetical protein ACYCS0_01025 [bacterium]
MINNLTAPADALRQIEEENIDIAAYQVESGLDDLFGMMQYCRHNNPELFEENLIRFKETEAKILEMGSRIKSMANMIKLEKAMRGGRL